jgi:glycosyltransferase involved in cell wall biosynthesis
MERTPSIVSIDATGLLAMERSRSFSRFSHRPSIAHDRAVFRAAGAIVAASAWAANDLATLYPDCARKVQVMPYPIDSRLFNSSWADERVARTSADTGHPVRVLFVGGDFPRKGGYELLGAWREGAFAGRAVLDLVTDWPLSAGELPPGVNLVQGVSSYSQEWFELWRQADLFVMPTRHEAFGMVYQEAAAAAIPAVATGIHAIPEIVQDGRTGLIVDPGDQDGLVRAMRTLVDSPELRNRMGQAARCRIASVADPALYASKLRNLVQRMVIANVENPS